MKEIEIVLANEKHIDDIAIIENLSFKIPWSRQSIAEEIIQNEIAIYVCAVKADKVLGYAGMWQVCDEGHITNIAVHPEFRNCGIGNRLMEKLLAIAAERSIVALTLEVRLGNASAQTLYRKHGFETGGTRKAYYADNNEDAIIMWKKISVQKDN